MYGLVSHIINVYFFEPLPFIKGLRVEILTIWPFEVSTIIELYPTKIINIQKLFHPPCPDYRFKVDRSNLPVFKGDTDGVFINQLKIDNCHRIEISHFSSYRKGSILENEGVPEEVFSFDQLSFNLYYSHMILSLKKVG